MTSVVVTGSGGFIGRRVVCAANSAGYGVTAMVRKPYPDAVHSVIQHDLSLPMDKLPPADWIFHLAGAYDGAGDEELQNADLAMARNVIHCGLAAGIKNWIFASAAEVYGDVHGTATEEAPTEPVIPYGRIKLKVERLLLEKTKDISNCRVVILRIGEVYGSESRLITELTARLKRSFCPWSGTRDVPLSFVHVDDVAQAFSCVVRSAPAGISVYNVADDVPTTWLDFLASRSAFRNPASRISSGNGGPPLCDVRHAGLPSHRTRADSDSTCRTAHHHAQGPFEFPSKTRLGVSAALPQLFRRTGGSTP